MGIAPTVANLQRYSIVALPPLLVQFVKGYALPLPPLSPLPPPLFYVNGRALRFVLVCGYLFPMHIFSIVCVCVCVRGVCVVCVCGLVPQAMDGARRHCRGTGRRRRPPILAGAGRGAAPSHARTAACLEHAGVRIDRARNQDVDLLCDRVRQAGAVVLDACVSINRVKTNRSTNEAKTISALRL